MEKRALEILLMLVRTPSAPKDDKKEIIEMVLRPLEKLGFQCESMGEPDCPALLACKGEGGVMLSGHLDTVPLGEGWTHEQGDVQGDLLFGRGSADMKGGCAAMMITAEELARTSAPLVLAFTTDEEHKMRGAEFIAKREEVVAAPGVIVCEPTDLKIGSREKGLLQVKLTAQGRSAHAAMPREGENAVHKMISALEKLQPLVSNSDDTSDSLTLSVSVMRGGERVNVIPDSCVAEIDIRAPPDRLPADILDTLRGLLVDAGVEVHVINRLDPVVIPEDSEAVMSVNKLRPGIGRIDIAYATELVKFGERNRNLLALGPGDPKYCHRADERIIVKDVAEAARLYTAVCRDMTG
jgi:acetylornithine deacetylase/succinyl-diaminopimelate desuccinylase-like protein